MLLGAGAVITDIIEQRHAEQALRIMHQQMEAIMESLDEGVIALRPDGSLAVLNAAARQLMLADPDPTVAPATAQDLIARSVIELRDADGQPISPAEWPLMRVLRGEHFHNWDLRLRTPTSSEEHWVTFSGMTIAAENGRPALSIVTRRDITERKRNEAAVHAHAEVLSRSNTDLSCALQLKDEFLAMMSHELRTPLNAVLGTTEALEAETYGSITVRQRQALTTVRESGRHLLGILSDILDLAYAAEAAVGGRVDVPGPGSEVLCPAGTYCTGSAAARHSRAAAEPVFLCESFALPYPHRSSL
ncbi:MAG: histidine kinase dimerization/phospho-acceptor domain-containing protein [Chloroflexales bacterium]